MKEKYTLNLKKQLMKRRNEILKQAIPLHLEQERAEQHFIEAVDEAQNQYLEWLVHKLDERGKFEIQEIDHAIDKIESGTYGHCEMCNQSIPFKRLRVLPATRLCLNCAKKYEEFQKLPSYHRHVNINNEKAGKYRNFDNLKEFMKKQ